MNYQSIPSPDSPLVMGVLIFANLMWAIAYVLIIYHGFKYKTYGVPMVAICLNISWEFIYSFIIMDPNPIRLLLYRIWFVLDCIIIFQLFIYGKKAQLLPYLKEHYHVFLVTTLISAYFGMTYFIAYYDDHTGAESALIINLLMSVLFVFLFLQRNTMRGLSYGAAWTKMIGTALTSVVVYYLYPPEKPDQHDFRFLTFLSVLIFLWDILYIFLLRNHRKIEKIQQEALRGNV